MFRLSNSELTSVLPVRSGAIASVTSSARRSPFARLDCFANYRLANGEVDFSVATVSVPFPSWEGEFYRIDVAGLEIVAVPGFIGPILNPTKILPGYYWVKSEELVLYSSDALPDKIVVEVIRTLVVPIPDFTYTYRISIGDFAVTKVESEGLRYYPAQNPASPQVHEFQVIDGVLEIYASNTCAPRIGGRLLVFGEYALSLPTPQKAATFILEQSFYPDILDYQGRSFTRNLKGWGLNIGEFVWNTSDRQLTAVGV